MTDKRIKSYLEDRLKMLESIRNEREWTTSELGDIACCKQTLAFINSMQEEPVSGLDNGNMPVERWKQAVEAASNQRNYRSSKGLTETRDDYFVDGVQWADEHPKEEPVSEELEEASKEWLKPQLDKSYADYGEVKMMELTHFDGYAMLDAIEFGAKWKEEQFEKNRLAACDKQTEEEAEIESDFVMSIIEKEHRQPTFDDAIKYGMRLQKKQMIKEALDGVLSSTITGSEQVVSAYVGYGELGKNGDKVKIIILKED